MDMGSGITSSLALRTTEAITGTVEAASQKTMALVRRAVGNTSKSADYRDFFIDLGTATGLVSSGGVRGTVRVQNPLTGIEEVVDYIPTIVARKKPKVMEVTGLRAKYEEWRLRRLKFKNEYDLANATEPGKVRLPRDNEDADIKAVGYEAFAMWDRIESYTYHRAVERGNIGDDLAYLAVLRRLIRLIDPSFQYSFDPKGPKVRIFIAAPYNATSEHLETIKRVITEYLKAEVIIIWEQFAAAIGAGIRYKDVTSCSIAGIGGGTNDILVLSNGEVVFMQSYTNAGNVMDLAIQDFLRVEKHLKIGITKAMAIKEYIGSALPVENFDDRISHTVRGSSTKTMRPAQAQVTGREIRACLQPCLRDMVRDFEIAMERMHGLGTVHGDIKEKGFDLTGGTAKLRGLPDYLRAKTRMEMRLASNPLDSVLLGLEEISKNENLLAQARAA